MTLKHKDLEEGKQLSLDFDKLSKVAACGQSVIPAVAQHAETGEVLVVAFVNQQALNYSLTKKMATFWSTSRNELWIKGGTSGEYLDLIETRVNCEQNSILYRVLPRGAGACHTKLADGTPRMTCYYRKITDQGDLEQLVD